MGYAITVTTCVALAGSRIMKRYGDWVSFRGSALQLALNVVSLLVAATLTLMFQRSIYLRRRRHA